MVYALTVRKYTVQQGCLTRRLQATFCPRSCFVWPARSFCAVDFLMEIFFLVFNYFLGQIPEILAKVSTDFIQQTCNFLEFNLGKNARGPQ